MLKLDKGLNAFWVEYQERAWAFCQEECNNSEYLLAGILGESGEVSEKVKRWVRTDYLKRYPTGQDADKTFRGEVLKELCDGVWYCFALASLAKVSLGNTGGFRAPEASVLPLPYKCRTVGCLNMVKAATRICDLFVTYDELRNLEDDPITPFIMAQRASSYLDTLGKLAAGFGESLYYVANLNLLKLSDRKNKNTLVGSGDNR